MTDVDVSTTLSLLDGYVRTAASKLLAAKGRVDLICESCDVKWETDRFLQEPCWVCGEEGVKITVLRVVERT